MYTKPDLREKLKTMIMNGSKGGNPGQWSARKAQLLAKMYEKAGGKYTGPKTEAQRSLSRWSSQKWRTKSGKPSVVGKGATGERYLPAQAIKALSKREYEKTTELKRRGIKMGVQYVAQPKSISAKTRKYRKY